jgi:hypothetical protein
MQKYQVPGLALLNAMHVANKHSLHGRLSARLPALFQSMGDKSLYKAPSGPACLPACLSLSVGLSNQRPGSTTPKSVSNHRSFTWERSGSGCGSDRFFLKFSLFLQIRAPPSPQHVHYLSRYTSKATWHACPARPGLRSNATCMTETNRTQLSHSACIIGKLDPNWRP